MKPATINGTFSATNPENGYSRHFDMKDMGWISTTGYFHWNDRKVAPVYARRRAEKLYLNSFSFIKGTIG